MPSRTDLAVPYAEKDRAKALGARWDAARKCWYVQNVSDLAPFAQWLREGAGPSPRPAAAAAVAVAGKVPRTGPKEPPKHCGCDVLPWEACAHTRA